METISKEWKSGYMRVPDPERDEACRHGELSKSGKYEMRLKVRYAVKGKTYEREVTFTSDSNSVPKTLLLKCDRKEPGNVLTASVDRSDELLTRRALIASVIVLVILSVFAGIAYAASLEKMLANIEEMSPEVQQLWVMFLLSEWPHHHYYP